MKTKRVAFILVIAALAVAAIACNLSASLAEPDVDEMATSVAATVTAMGVGDETPTTGEPLKEPGTPTTAPPDEPDILRVAYTAGDRNLWYWEDGISPRQLTTSGDVSNVKVSYDGARIAFIRGTDFMDHNLWVINNDGSNERRLVSAGEFSSLSAVPDSIGAASYNLAWVPGEHTLAFVIRPLFEGPGFLLNNDLWLVNAETGDRRELLPRGQGGMFTYSPDGRQIAIVSSMEVSLINADGSNRRSAVLTYTPVTTYSEYAYHVQPVWAPDSSHLRVVVPPQDPLMPSPRPPTGVWHIPTDGTPASQIASLDVFFLDPVALSPDLKRLAYLKPLAAEVTDNRRDLRIAAVDGSGDTLYTTGDNITIHSWSPDSEHFVFSTNEIFNTQLGQVGAGFAPLSESGYAVYPQWVDQERFMFITSSAAGWELRLGRIGAPSTVIASGSGNPLQLQISYDFRF